jgi:gliding motility-associated-like protein
VNVARLFTKFNITNTNICNGTGRVSIDDSVYSSSNSPMKDFYWTFTDSANKTIKGVEDTFIPTNPGSYMLKLYAENTFGCVSRDSVKIGVYTRPVIAAADDKMICKGEQIPITVTGNPDFVEWTPTNSLNKTTGNSVMAKPDSTTNYIVKAYNYLQCPVYDTVKVTVKTRLDARAYPDTSVCMGDTIQLHVFAENTSLHTTKITWQSAPTLSSLTDLNPYAYPKTNTTYYALIENGACQLQKIPVNVDVKPNPSVVAGEDKILINGSEVQIDANSPDMVSYLWSPPYKLSCIDCQSPMASPERDTSYTITAINQYGCRATDNLRIQVIEDCSGSTIYVPNTFSPNGDGQNDVLRVLGPGVASVKLFRVFNRWGQMIFSSSDTNVGWDGTFNGTELNPGVYMYYMDVECINGQRSIKKGDVTLLK